MRGSASAVVTFSTVRARRTRLAASALARRQRFGAVGNRAAGPALAQRADAPGVMTPMGRAPLSFADIVDRVKRAVVSISVSSGGRAVAQAPNQKSTPGTPGARWPRRPAAPADPRPARGVERVLPQPAA